MPEQASAPMGHTPQYVALLLMREIAFAEKKELGTGPSHADRADRAWILDTYAECLRTVFSPHGRLAKRQGD